MSTAAGRAPGASLAADAGSEELRQEVLRLRERLATTEAALDSMRDRCDDVEETKAHLTRMAVASALLHDTDDETDSLHNLLDLLVNLIGTEQIAVWRLSADGDSLELRASQGISTEPWHRIPANQGLLGRAVTSGEIVVEEDPSEGCPTVGIPLLVGRRAVGVVAVFRLLPHRGRLGARDWDVFRMISQQAGFALCCSSGSWGGSRKAGDG
jgi:putative methionine-R-sulfoxide reductase with GAF domain